VSVRESRYLTITGVASERPHSTPLPEVTARAPGTTVELLKGVVDDVHDQLHDDAVTLDRVEFVHFYYRTCVLKRLD